MAAASEASTSKTENFERQGSGISDFRSGVRARSAPSIPAPNQWSIPPTSSTWHVGKNHTGMMLSSTQPTCWRRLGGSWRDWDISEARTKPGYTARSPDEGGSHINGCVPNWGKQSAVRMRGVLEHEITWAYYRMQKHGRHPHRQEVGETLPPDQVDERMRNGFGNRFHFWRDLRPPFSIFEIHRVDTGDVPHGVSCASAMHPDGDLYTVEYECAIEYFAERLMDTNNNNSTYDNRIHGVAQVRIPNGFPSKQKRLSIVSWGQPTLNPPEGGDKALHRRTDVPPKQWMPIAQELGVKPTSKRMERCVCESEEASKRLQRRKKYVRVPELQKLLIGPQASLPRLARSQQAAQPDAGGGGEDERPGSRVRRHTIYTPSVGFVSYAG